MGKYQSHKPTDRMTRLKLHCLGKGPLYKIANEAHMHPSYLSHYCNGTRSISPLHLTNLARVLKVKPVDLLGWVDLPKAITDLEPKDDIYCV